MAHPRVERRAHLRPQRGRPSKGRLPAAPCRSRRGCAPRKTHPRLPEGRCRSTPCAGPRSPPPYYRVPRPLRTEARRDAVLDVEHVKVESVSVSTRPPPSFEKMSWSPMNGVPLHTLNVGATSAGHWTSALIGTGPPPPVRRLRPRRVRRAVRARGDLFRRLELPRLPCRDLRLQGPREGFG